MKLRLIALAAMTAASGVALAGTKTGPGGNLIVDAASASTIVVRLSGATALRNTAAGEALAACGGAGSVNGGVTTTTYNFTPPATFSNNLWGVTCRLPAAYNGVPAGTDIAFFKTDQGGSAQGVFPVALGVARPFLSVNVPTGCAAGNGPAFTACTTAADAPVDFGISDLEPAAFKGENVPKFPQDPDAAAYPPDGLSPAQLASLTITPVVQTVFAVAVNTNLYNEMFAKQGLASVTNPVSGAACTTADFAVPVCTPSIGYAEARTFFSGGATDWRLVVRTTDPLLRSPVNICRRVDGSGTQAASNFHLRQQPCNTGGAPLALADYSYSTVTDAGGNPPSQISLQSTAAQLTAYLNTFITTNAAEPVGSPSLTFVFEGPGTGDVINCLNRANTVGGYALGHVSKENAIGTGNWRHVKLEGAYPTRDALKAGQYDYAFESTIQWVTSTFNAFPANKRNLIQGLTNNFRAPAGLARLSANAQLGVAALPDAYAGDFGTGTAAEIAFGSRVTRGGNSCTAFTAVK